MKKILYTLSFLGLAATVVAQPALKLLPNHKAKVNVSVNAPQERMPFVNENSQAVTAITPSVAPSNHASFTRGAAIWSNDFDNPEEWIVGNEGEPSADWIITDQGPQGEFSESYGLIESTSGGNFALFDSDFLGSSSSIQNAWIQFEDPIDLTDYPCISIEFESYYNNFGDVPAVEFSLDGEEWLGFNAHPDLGVNDLSDNPTLVVENLGSFIGGQPTVYLRFRFIGDRGYFWMVDDVRLIIPADNDIAIDEAYYNNWTDQWYSISSILEVETWDDVAFVSGYEFSHMPASQPHPLNFRVFVSNEGCAIQTGVKLVATVESPAGFQTFESLPISIGVGEDTLLFLDNVVPTAFNDGIEGVYTVSFAVSANEVDQNLGNNDVPDKRFRLTNQEIGNDDFSNVPEFVGATNNRTIGVRYTFNEATTLTHIKFALWNNPPNQTSSPGELLFPNVRAASVIQPAGPNNPAIPLYGINQIEYLVTEDDFNGPATLNNPQYVIIPLPNVGNTGMPPQVMPGRVYQAEMRFPNDIDGATKVRILMNDTDETFGAVEFTPGEGNQSSFGQGWFSFPFNPILRFALEGSPLNAEGIDDLRFDMGQNFPNPTTGETTIEWRLIYPGKNVHFDIYDLSGRKVFSKDLGDRPAGQQEPLILNLDNLSAGNYQYSLTVGDERMVRKMVIVK